MIGDIILLVLVITVLAAIVVGIYRFWFGYKCRFCGVKLHSQREKETLVCYQCEKEKK